MKIFGRRTSKLDLLRYLAEWPKMFLNTYQFRNQLDLFNSYIKKTFPNSNFFELKNGKRIHLSSNVEDVITIMIVFGKKEYGEIEHGDVVIDIGANIGAFSLYAALNGAQKVYSFEPNREAFLTLKKNTESNKFGNIIKPFNMAVSDKLNETATVSSSSSPFNKIITNESGNVPNNVDYVKCTTLESIFKENNLKTVDLLKIDCEGCEFRIFNSIPDEILSRIKKIRIEVHGNGLKKEKLINRLSEYLEPTQKSSMIYWFSKFDESNKGL